MLVPTLRRVTILLGLATTTLLLAFLPFAQLRNNVNPAKEVEAASMPTNANFTITGTVTCSTTGSKAGVEVFAWNRDTGEGEVVMTTGSSGAFSVTLDQGSYDLVFNPPCNSGCASQSIRGINGAPDLPLVINLPTGLSVSGATFATNGSTPVDNTAIYAFNRTTADGYGLPPSKGTGQYCINLTDGSYDLSFTPPACADLGPVTQVITVDRNIVLDVSMPPGFTVAGCITDGSANPVGGVEIFAYDPAVRGFGFSPSKAGGCYTGTLPLGTFDIQFIPPGGQGLGYQTIIDVGSEGGSCPNTSLPVTLPPGFTISGKITCHGQPVKNVFVYADPVGAPKAGDDLDGVGKFSLDDGTYELPVVSGSYHLEFIPPPATGFPEKMFDDVPVHGGITVNVDFCPLYFPIVLKAQH